MRLSHETEKDTDFQALSPSDYKLEGQTERRGEKRERIFSGKTEAWYV